MRPRVRFSAWRTRCAIRLALACVTLVVMAAAASLIPASSAQSATLHILDYHSRIDPAAFFPEPICNAKLEGEIVSGNAAEMAAQVTDFFTHPAIAADADGTRGKITRLALCLSSPGGDLVEAVKLSELFEGWNTVVEEGDTCASACAILFMRAQSALDLFDWPVPVQTSRRYLHLRAKLGFHAPELVLPPCAGATLTPAQTMQMYARALRSVRSVVVGDATWLVGGTETGAKADGAGQGAAKDVAAPACLQVDPPANAAAASYVGFGRYARQKLPMDLVLAFLLTPPGEMYWITTIEEALNWHIDVIGLPKPKMLSERMLETACMNAIYLGCQKSALNNACLHENEQYDTKDHRSLGGHAKSKLKLWPQPGKKSALTVQAFRVDHSREAPPVAKGTPYPCTIRAVWHTDKLQDLDLQSFNSNLQNLVQPALSLSPKDAQDLMPDTQPRRTAGQGRLWPWAMLPAGRKLTDLGSAPWQALETGGNFFDKPTNW